MSLPLYGVEAHSGQVITLDDESVVKDQASSSGSGGNAYVAFVLSTIFDILAGGYATFRRAVQHVHADGAVTVDITPYRDQQESGSSITRVLAIGANPIVVAPLLAHVSNFQVKGALSAFDDPAE